MNTFQDQEYEEETGWVKFKWRNHQPEIGRFFNVDPLAESYVYNSPYAFSENRVVNGIELEGLEYVNANDAKVYISKGSIKLNTKNLSYSTQQVIRTLNSNTSNWGGQSYGVDTRLTSFESVNSNMKFSSKPNTEGRMNPFANQGRLKIGVQNKLPDQYMRSQSISFFTPSSSANKAFGVIQLMLLLKDETVKANYNTDKSETFEDLKLALRAINEVQVAYDEGEIILPLNGTPLDGAITEEYLYKIADYVYRGEDGGDEVVSSNGARVWRKIQRKVEKELLEAQKKIGNNE